MTFSTGECYQKDLAWCIIVENNETTTTWRTAADPTRHETPTAALMFYLEAEGWELLPFKVSPDYRCGGVIVMSCG